MSVSKTIIRELLCQASQNEALAARIAEDPEAVAEEHGLGESDSRFLGTLRSVEAVHVAHRTMSVKASTRPPSRSVEMIAHGCAGLFLFYLMTGLIPSLARTRFFESVAEYQLLAVLIGSPVLLLSVYYLFLRFRQVSKPAQVTLALLITVAMFVPGTVIFQGIDPGTRAAVVRILVVIIFAALPSSFYVLFILNKKKTLWEEFKYNLQQLDPVRHEKLAELYRKKFEALYGVPRSNGANTQLLNGEALFPILLNTVIIALGWVLCFFHASGEVAQSAARIAPSVAVGGAGSTFTFGFLGAYLFSVQLLYRRYVQSDLRSSTYNHCSQRIVSTWVFALVVEQMSWTWILPQAPEPAQLALIAFAIGVFPQIGWQLIGQSLQRGLGLVNNSFKQLYPLNRISGVTVWVEARLLEEDIENVQNLVTADIIDLMLRTNLHPRRIVDWIDQGILLLHVEQGSQTWLKSTLAAHGVLTATDLVTAFGRYQAERRPAGDDTDAGSFLEAGQDVPLRNLVSSIENSPNMYFVKAWRGVNRELREHLGSAVALNVRVQNELEPGPRPGRIAA